MERKNIIFYSGLAVAGVAVVIGVILFLRSRNAPQEYAANQALTQPAKTTQTQAGKAAVKQVLPSGVAPFKPLDAGPVAPAWKPGSPGPKGTAKIPQYDYRGPHPVK